jgi:hypothetical protein
MGNHFGITWSPYQSEISQRVFLPGKRSAFVLHGQIPWNPTQELHTFYISYGGGGACWRLHPVRDKVRDVNLSENSNARENWVIRTGS